MAPPAVGAGTLRRLGEMSSGGLSVLSIYLDLDSARSPTPTTREAGLEALLAGAGHAAGGAEANRMREMLRSMPELEHGARGLAMFSSAEGSVFEAVPLPCGIEPMAVADTLPWLEPLAALFTPGDWGVAVLGRRVTRLFRGGSRMLVEFAAVHDDPHGGDTRASRPELRRRRPIDHRMAEQARRVAGLLLRAHRRRTFDRLAVAGPSEQCPLLEDALASDLLGRLAGFIGLDLQDASPQEIVRAVAPVVAQAERDGIPRLLGAAAMSLPIGSAGAS